MTPTNEQLAFFNGVTNALRKTSDYFHWYTAECFTGECTWNSVSNEDVSRDRPCNWKEIQSLAFEFFNNAPDIDDDWKWLARTTGFDPDDLHDILLGVFLGSDKSPGYFGTTISKGTP